MGRFYEALTKSLGRETHFAATTHDSIQEVIPGGIDISKRMTVNISIKQSSMCLEKNATLCQHVARLSVGQVQRIGAAGRLFPGNGQH